MEVLARLCQVVNNWDLLSENLEHRVYEDIVNLLTVHDIQLIVFTLEALYHLSELGEIPSNHIAKVYASIGGYLSFDRFLVQDSHLTRKSLKIHTSPFKNLNKPCNFVIFKEILEGGGKKGQVGNYFQNNENDLVILLEKHGKNPGWKNLGSLSVRKSGNPE